LPEADLQDMARHCVAQLAPVHPSSRPAPSRLRKSRRL
jgi:hypothetical protein